MPVDPDPYGDLANQLVGPDALGRLYLVEGDRLLRSDDQGCSWNTVATSLAKSTKLLTSDRSESLYLHQNRELSVSLDGGLTATVVTDDCPLELLAADGTLLIGRDDDDILASTDGGTTWNLLTVLPDRGLGVSADSAAVDHLVYNGRDDVWAFDGATWTAVLPEDGFITYLARLYDGVLGVDTWTNSQDPTTSVLLRSETGQAPFDAIAWEPDIDDSHRGLWIDGAQVVLGGSWDPGRNSDAYGPVQGLVVVVDGTTVHRHLAPGMEDVVGVALMDDVMAVGLMIFAAPVTSSYSTSSSTAP
jgi:hypothetical protein